MASIHLIGGEKGGVGKSVVARLLAQYMIDHEKAFIGFDTDRSHGALMRFYRDYASPTLVNNFESLDAIVEVASEQPDLSVLVDLAAQTHQPLCQWLAESGVLELADELGIRICYWNVMDSGQDCVDLLGRLIEQFDDRIEYVLVRNQLRDDNFAILESSGLMDDIQRIGASMLDLKRLHAPTMTKIDRNSYSFWAARNRDAESEHGLSLLERQRVKIWVNHAYSQMKALAL